MPRRKSNHRAHETETELSMSTTGTPKTTEEIQKDWDTNPRWNGVTRNFTAQQVSDLQGSVVEDRKSTRLNSSHPV